MDWPSNILSVLQCALLAGHLGLQDHFTIDEVGAVNIKSQELFYISSFPFTKKKRKDLLSYGLHFNSISKF